MKPALPFPQGTAYYPDHWPAADWPRDLDRIAAAGIQTIRFGEFSWSWFQPSATRWEWQGYDRFVDLCHKKNLQLILCTPTATLPPWLLHKYPDCRLVDADGKRCFSHRHHWSWRHAPSQRAVARAITALAQRYGNHPAVCGWQIDNEPNYAEEPHNTYDYHPAALAVYRAWLKQKYRSLAALNAAWYTNFWSQRVSDWEQIGVTHRAHRCNPNMLLDFLRFRDWNLAQMVHWQAALLRRHTRNQKIGTNIPETGAAFSVQLGQDFAAQARCLDWVGTDLYCASGDRAKDLRALACNTDILRSAAGPAEFFIAETQGGPHARTWPQAFAGEVFKPDYLRDSVHTYAARGASRVFWFLWRPTPGGTEIGMNGVQNPDGTDTPRTALVREISAAAPRLAKLRALHLRRPLAYVHYSRDSLRFLHFWKDTITPTTDPLQGAHRLLELAGYRVDFITELSGNWKRDTGHSFPLLVLPRSDLLSPSEVRALQSHLASGGRVLAGPHTGLLNEHGHWHARPPLESTFAARQGYWFDHAPLPKLAALPALKLSGHRELTPLAAQPLLGFTPPFATHPAALTHDGATLLAFDLFALAPSATDAQLKTLITKLHLRP